MLDPYYILILGSMRGTVPSPADLALSARTTRKCTRLAGPAEARTQRPGQDLCINRLGGVKGC